ncbi:VOC family protein [Thiomicrorhabdus lithotrophica]|uniref:VOC family protein n=1 Tax=Thiomicrorhabdus lithotrophica TaxID=2949997 RepID=A0ABY8CBS9_9GAMM|nr:VOC family protein [Thiomicrorhabdus lithotrophica]WEJ61578.1 VOC family protein [Thiomicrorhabdus lithotrophica]
MSKIIGLDHVSIIVKDAEASLAFYQGLLGVTLLERPSMAFPGYWVNLFEGQSLHIMQIDNPNENTIRPEHGGRDYHFALRVDSIDEYAEKLKSMKLPFTLSESGRKALFARDLDNNAFELFEYKKSESV